MAGRPRAMARKVENLCKQAQEYRLTVLDRSLAVALKHFQQHRDNLAAVMPSRYAEEPAEGDKLHAAWREASETALEHHLAVWRLYELLLAKVSRAEEQAQSRNTS